MSDLWGPWERNFLGLPEYLRQNSDRGLIGTDRGFEAGKS
jgi:hypothetical protein